MKVGDLVKPNMLRWPDIDEIDEFGIGIIVSIDDDIVSKHVEVYADNRVGWYDSSQVETIKRENA
jgi:hypothetical protein